MHDPGPEALTDHPAVSRRAHKHWLFRFRERRKISPKRTAADFFSTLLGEQVRALQDSWRERLETVRRRLADTDTGSKSTLGEPYARQWCTRGVPSLVQRRASQGQANGLRVSEIRHVWR